MKEIFKILNVGLKFAENCEVSVDLAFYFLNRKEEPSREYILF